MTEGKHNGHWHIVRDVDDGDDDDDDGVYLTAACYTMGGLEKRLCRYEPNCTGSQYGPVVSLCGQ